MIEGDFRPNALVIPQFRSLVKPWPIEISHFTIGGIIHYSSACCPGDDIFSRPVWHSPDWYCWWPYLAQPPVFISSFFHCISKFLWHFGNNSLTSLAMKNACFLHHYAVAMLLRIRCNAQQRSAQYPTGDSAIAFDIADIATILTYFSHFRETYKTSRRRRNKTLVNQPSQQPQPAAPGPNLKSSETYILAHSLDYISNKFRKKMLRIRCEMVEKWRNWRKSLYGNFWSSCPWILHIIAAGS